jgi:hypothetical protein
VDASTPLRRLLLAWARQAPGILGNNAPGSMDWHLDPTDRARAVLPMADWQDADLVIVNSRPAWVVQGLLPIAEFPLTTRADWGDSRVAGLVPAFLCVVDPVTGETRFYLDPGADSLGVAWARAIGPLVEPAPAIPGDLRRALTYPVAWFEAQLQVLQAAAWGGGTMPRPGPHRGVTAPVRGLPRSPRYGARRAFPPCIWTGATAMGTCRAIGSNSASSGAGRRCCSTCGTR